MASESSSSATGLQMDEFLEILNLPSWSDIGGLRNQLEFNSSSSAELGALTNPEIQDSGKQVGVNEFPHDGSQQQQPQVGGDQFLEAFRQQPDDPFLIPNQNQNQLLPLENHLPLGGVSAMGISCDNTSLNSASTFPFLQQTLAPDAGSIASPAFGAYDSRVWRQQPYIGDLQQQLLKPEMFLTGSNNSNPLLSARYRSPGTIPSGLRQSLHREVARGVFSSYGLGQQKPPLQASSRGSYRNTQPAPIAPMSGAPRPRVRARRGQATDPHSIAERQRRERIAERMKDLQGLVPNVNKTDKAIMLDEIIEYVKFLQLQSKIFSMCRMGSSGSVPCNLPPSEYSSAMAASLGQSNGTSAEALANLERQVARLMDESMGSALQFLQSKGFCLMPVSMAAALSATKSIHQPIFSGDKTETSTVVTERPQAPN